MDSGIPYRKVSLVHPSGHPTACHVHPCGQVFRVMSGLLIVETDAGRWVVPPGWLGWVPPGVRHAAWAQSALQGDLLYLEADWCMGLPSQPVVMAPEPLRDLVFGRLADQPASLDRLRSEHLLAVLHDELAVAHAQSLLLPMPADPRLRRLAAALLDSPGDERPARAWALLIGMGERTLSRRFVQETGMHFVHWRQLVRLQHALACLGSGKSVEWVAQSCGYASTSAFIKVYRRYLGVTPGRQTRSQM